MKKQKLKQRRKTNTPTSASQARSNCDLRLKKEETLSVADLKTCSNNPEVNLSQHRTAKRKVIVYVISIDGKQLMPCTPAKCKKLLKLGKAKVYKMYPFTIQLNFECENQTQDVTFSEDSGYGNIGFSAVTDKKELASGTVLLDDKTSVRLTEKAMYRRGRRSRHHWYRKPRFSNRKKKQGWLPPSTQRRYDAHLRLLKIYQEILPITKVNIETANFDIQKIMNPEIEGVEYQQGNLYGYENLKSFIIAREKGKCQLCGEEKGKQKWNLHHKDERKENGTDRPENFALLHEKCHIKLHKKELKFEKPKQFKAENFMSTVHKMFVRDIPNVNITFGYITFIKRNELKLEKTHYNDAFVIAGGTNQERITPIEIKQKHRNNRSLGQQRKGYAPTSRKQHYKIQPNDLVWIDGEKFTTSGSHCKGTKIILKENKKSVSIKKVQKIYNFGSYVFN